MLDRPDRRPSSMEVWLSFGAVRRTVALLDVSETGVKTTVPEGLKPGMAVALVTPRLMREAEVRWIHGRQAGLVLDAALNQEEQRELAGLAFGI